MDVSHTCRCCLRRPPDKDCVTPYTHLGKTEIYSDMLKECFDLHLSMDGECGICEVCVGRLRDASDFKLQVQRSQAELQLHLKASVYVKAEPTVKSEMPDDSMEHEAVVEVIHDPLVKVEPLSDDNEMIQDSLLSDDDRDPLVKPETLSADNATIENSLLSERIMDTDSDQESSPEDTEKLPEKSKHLYKKTYDNFTTWRLENNEASITEATLLAYFEYLKEKFKPSSLWTEFSKLKSTISMYDKTDISSYKKLSAWLKKAQEGFKAKQARTFSQEDLEKFVNEAPDQVYLLIKSESTMPATSVNETESSDYESETPTENPTIDNLPEKSKEQYLKVYDNFIKWRTFKCLNSCSETVLLKYFKVLSTRVKPPTLSSIYSMLKTTIIMKHNIKIDKYKELTAFVKACCEGYKPKKTKLLTSDNIDKFLKEAPDLDFLLMKVVLIFGLDGACRNADLPTITVDNVRRESDDLLSVTVPEKNKKERIFYIRGEHKQVVDKYISLRPSKVTSSRFFITYRGGKCVNQVIGKNKFSKIPRDIATFLNLKNPELYTGHCIRQTSASLLANSTGCSRAMRETSITHSTSRPQSSHDV